MAVARVREVLAVAMGSVEMAHVARVKLVRVAVARVREVLVVPGEALAVVAMGTAVVAMVAVAAGAVLGRSSKQNRCPESRNCTRNHR